MKKLFFSALVTVFCITTGQAQVEKGNWWFGADAGLTFNSTSSTPELDGDEIDAKTTASVLSFTPSANYFIINNLSIGLDLSVSSNKTKFESDFVTEDFTTTTFGIIPNATYFFGASNFKPFLSAGLGYLSTGGEEDSFDFSGLALRGQGGLAYFVNEAVSINFSVAYTNANLKNKENSDAVNKTNTLGLGLGFAVYL